MTERKEIETKFKKNSNKTKFNLVGYLLDTFKRSSI